MFGWLRDALASAPSSFGYRHSNTPSSFLHHHQQKQKQHEHFSSDDEEINKSNDNSFYHNPYHSSGQMNYADVPQQQYTNEHNYPTYLARQQTSNTINQTLDDQIHTKLLSLKQRSNQFPCYAHRQNNYAYRNRTIPTAIPSKSIPHSSLISNQNGRRRSSNEQRSDDDDDDDDEGEEGEDNDDNDDNDDDDDDDDDDDERSSSIGNYRGIPGYYSGQYSNIDEQFDLASVVLWYKNVMQSVKKFLPNGPNYIQSERSEYNNNNNNNHYSISSKSPILSRQTNEDPNISLSPSSKVKWIGAVRTVTQLNQVRKRMREINVN